MFMKRNIELEKNIVDEYRNGKNNKFLRLKYNKSRSYIQKVLIRHDVKLRKASEITKKYDINEDYFTKIDTPNKAYILGFLFADGTIYKNFVKLNLIETDVDILFDIAKEIFNEKPYSIKEIKGEFKKWKNNREYYSKPQKSLNICRKKIADDLRKHGLIDKKTYKIRLPKLNKNLYSHFIRGYFDGDGNIYISPKYSNNNRVHITSNNNFICDIQTLLFELLNMETIITKTQINNIDRLSIYGNNKVLKFLDWMYDDAELKLERKYLKYLKMF